MLWQALALLLRAQCPALGEEELHELLGAKFTCLAACQRYQTMSRAELLDVEALLDEFPSLCIAYIEMEEPPAPPGAPPRPPLFFSCLTDGSCELDTATGRRLPRHRVQLPGHPILGNGKSDNQNHAIIFSRGAIIQAIDANQEGYLEESLKLCAALREFALRPPGASRGPAIVGFREHIFSGIGLLGDLAASSELCFGTLVQRVMANTLWSRYHYGHPDMLDKVAMIGQGGISKATKGLNLSEDIFVRPAWFEPAISCSPCRL